MRNDVICGPLSAGLICLAAITAGAQSSKEWNQCVGKENVTVDQLIAGCSSVIRNGGGTRETLALAFVGRGSALMAKGDVDGAIQDYGQALSLNPNNFLAFNNRGFAYAAEGDFERAIQDYDQALLLNPNAALTFYNRGFALAAKAEFDHAIEDYDRAIGSNSNFSQAFLNRGFAYAAKGILIARLRITIRRSDSIPTSR
jgi:tetratricopeptide (TPR) repeat protein